MMEINQAQRDLESVARPEIVKPFQGVVKAAKRRIQAGELQKTLTGTLVQRVYLEYLDSKDHSGHRVYQIVDTKPGTQTWHYGLEIEGLQLDDLGEPVRSLTNIQLPRAIRYTTLKNLSNLRGCQVEDINRLAAEISAAEVISALRYHYLRGLYIGLGDSSRLLAVVREIIGSDEGGNRYR